MFGIVWLLILVVVFGCMIYLEYKDYVKERNEFKRLIEKVSRENNK